MSGDRAATVDEVVELYRRHGADHYDEELSQIDHALQTAALAEAAGASDELVAAALLHDVGHLLDLADGGHHTPGVDLAHQGRGARWLTGLFGPPVTVPVALHVRAKRYLCTADPAYAEGLSDGSRRSLATQGGPMTAEEVTAFERLGGFADAVALRRWDDAGKLDGLAVPDLDHYRPLLDRISAQRQP